MYLVVGLGNPGGEYKGSRHNIGFEVADRLAARHNTRIRRLDYRALTVSIKVGRSEVLIMKPQTYMNSSGRSVAAACRGLGIETSGLVVVHDDTDLETGRIRVRVGGSSAGHRGVGSIIDEAGGADCIRVRLGVGRPAGGGELTDYVLECFAHTESELVESMIERGTAAVMAVLRDGVASAMQTFNGAPPTGRGQ